MLKGFLFGDLYLLEVQEVPQCYRIHTAESFLILRVVASLVVELLAEVNRDLLGRVHHLRLILSLHDHLVTRVIDLRRRQVKLPGIHIDELQVFFKTHNHRLLRLRHVQKILGRVFSLYLDHRDYPLRRLRLSICGRASVSASRLRDFQKVFSRIFLYGNSRGILLMLLEE